MTLRGANVNPPLAEGRIRRQDAPMADKNTDKASGREARLAAKLRENLRRRKAQARAHEDHGDGEVGEPGADRGDAPALPKSPPAS
jgi:hypothetical protein